MLPRPKNSIQTRSIPTCEKGDVKMRYAELSVNGVGDYWGQWEERVHGSGEV